MKWEELIYIIFSAALLIIEVGALYGALRGMSKNLYAIWSPYEDIFIYIIGNMIITLCLFLRWFWDIVHTQSPLFFLGQSLTINSLLVLNNRMQAVLDEQIYEILPFWVCKTNNGRRRFTGEFLLSILPAFVCTIIDIVLSFIEEDNYPILFANDSLFLVIILYEGIDMLIAAGSFMKHNKAMTRYSKIENLMSVLTFLDAGIGQIVIWSFSMILLFSLPYDEATISYFIYVKDWISLIFYYTIIILLFISYKDIQQILLKMKQNADTECLLE